MEKNSGSGITITDADGNVQTLEEIVDDETAAELGDALQSSKFSLYHKPHLVVAGSADAKATTTNYTFAEINKFNWRRRTMSINKVNMVKAICELMATGEEYTIREIHKEFKKKQSVLDYDSVRFRVTHSFTKTRLKHLLNANKRKGLAKYYKLKSIASDMMPIDLMAIVYSRSNPDAYKEVCSKYPEVCSHIAELENPLPNKAKDAIKKLDESAPDKVPPQTLPTTLEETLGEKIGEALGMKVEVTGRVEIVFKFG